jgi:phosphatidylserine/phosphatidylglycerophosphate/cardiolipin synthase-like enzyme
VKATAAATAGALRDIGARSVEAMADALASGCPRESVPTASTIAGFAEAARQVLDAQRVDGVSDGELVSYLRGVADGYRLRERALSVEPVWTGPGSHRVPMRATAPVLVDLVKAARSHLLLMTYSAGPYQPLLVALSSATERGVEVDIAVETLQGAGSALNGSEPAAAFSGLKGARLWHWAPGNRASGARMHAKVAVADRSTLLVSSANLTSSGIDSNIEAGVLVRGGTAPERVVEHFTELVVSGVLILL